MRPQLHAPYLPAVLAASLTAALHIASLPAYGQVPKLDTATTIDGPICALYKGGAVDLVSKLSALATGLPLPGRQMDFSVGGAAAGFANTDTDGVATHPYNVDGLMAGDYPLQAAFAGDGDYNGSSDEATLGISYTFVGFQPPLRGRSPTLIKAGRALPVKIRLADAALRPVATASPSVWLHQWSPDTGLGLRLAAPPVSVGAANAGNTMRYSTMDQQYIFNLDTRGLPVGTYAALVEPGDSEACSQGPYFATFTVGKQAK